MTKKDPITQLCVSISNKYSLRANQATYQAAQPQTLDNVSNFWNAESCFFSESATTTASIKLTLKQATIPRSKSGSKLLPRDAQGNIIRPRENNYPNK